MTPEELRAWKERHGLTVAEMAWIFRRSKRTLERKLAGETRIVVIAGMIEDINDRLAMGVRPRRWPADLPPNPTETRRRRRRRKFSAAAYVGRQRATPPKCRVEEQLSAPI